MANFRRNHQQNKNPFAGLTLKVLLIFGILILLYFGIQRFFNDYSAGMEGISYSQPNMTRDYLPQGGDNLEVLHHQYYSCGYSEEDELSYWVSYILTEKDLRVPNVKRYQDYLSDPMPRNKSAHYKDYSNSGYTRGHLAPAGDMAFNKVAMKESFYMTNITPQKREFNNGIWKELEENVRDWAFHNDKLYITTGPIPSSIDGSIGRSGVSVPNLFYKAILDYSGGDKKAIGFVIPNGKRTEELRDFAVSIDHIEKRIGLDLFPDVYEDETDENHIESTFDHRKWKMSKKRYRERVDKWNKQ